MYGPSVVDTYGHFAGVGYLIILHNEHSKSVYALSSVFGYIKPFLSVPVVAVSGPNTACLQGIYGGNVRDLSEVP